MGLFSARPVRWPSSDSDAARYIGKKKRFSSGSVDDVIVISMSFLFKSFRLSRPFLPVRCDLFGLYPCPHIPRRWNSQHKNSKKRERGKSLLFRFDGEDRRPVKKKTRRGERAQQTTNPFSRADSNRKKMSSYLFVWRK